jgi:hypothetical protein
MSIKNRYVSLPMAALISATDGKRIYVAMLDTATGNILWNFAKRRLSDLWPFHRGRHPLLGIRLPKCPTRNRKQQSVRIHSYRLGTSKQALQQSRPEIVASIPSHQ